MEEKNKEKLIKSSPPIGDFLQSNEWQKFQESVGRKTFNVFGENFWANIIEHNLPMVGKYFYLPRGPIISKNTKNKIRNIKLLELVDLAKREKAGWIRIEPENNEALDLIKKNIGLISPRRTGFSIQKAPHDMQPKETLIMDISKSEEELLQEMKSKTRYNIRLAQKHKVSVQESSNFKTQISNKIQNQNDKNSKHYINEFLRLNRKMSERQGIVTHEESYYQKMFEILPESMIKLYVAEYENKIIAANIMVFYDDTVTYLHGASDDEYRNVMATYLLQWQAIKDAKAVGCKRYDFNGVKVNNKKGRSWEGITKFKLGFSPNTAPIEFPGCYDIIVSPIRYKVYRIIQKVKSFIK